MQWVLLALNGLSFAMLLFLVASGLTLTLGVMRLVNLAHGAFYLVGVYVAHEVTRTSGTMALGWVAGSLAAAVVGGVTYALLRRSRGDDLREAILTFGLALIVADLVLVRWGGAPISLEVPEYLTFTAQLGPISYPGYRLFLILVGVLFAVAMWVLAYRTSAGAKLRAVIDDPQMAESVGINGERLMIATFFIGAGMAGLAGVLSGAILGAGPGTDLEILLFALVVIVLGGAGSVLGALVGSIVVGLVNTFAAALIPELSLIAIFATMVVVLAVKPTGLAGSRA